MGCSTQLTLEYLYKKSLLFFSGYNLLQYVLFFQIQFFLISPTQKNGLYMLQPMNH